MWGRPPPYRFHKHILTTCYVLGLSWELGLSWVLGLFPRHSFQILGPPCPHIPWATRVKPLILSFISNSDEVIYLAVLGVSCSMWDL